MFYEMAFVPAESINTHTNRTPINRWGNDCVFYITCILIAKNIYKQTASCTLSMYGFTRKLFKLTFFISLFVRIFVYVYIFQWISVCTRPAFVMF